MGKVLTVSVAAYNVEAYIEENLESILASEARDDIEVLVVDDGGKDGTYEIVKRYEQKYPGIVYAVHKENGGYGSVQNYSIAHASGKYFKILDGDDWVDTEGLTRLVQYLRTADVDAVVTGYSKGPDKNNGTLFIFDKNLIGEIIDPNEMNIAVGMWALTYRTDVLRAANLSLPEHTLYTDKIFSTIPFTYTKTAIVFDYIVYCYRTGRDGQSISIESRIKHIDEYLMITEVVCRHCAEDKREHKEYVLLKSAAAYKVSIRVLLLLPSNNESLKKLTEYEGRIKVAAREVYDKSASLNTWMGWVIRFLRITRYRGYWILSKLPKKMIEY